MSTLTCKSCRKLEAAAADLRIRLQKAHGALVVFRDPNDPTLFNDNAVREVQALYSLPELLRQTRPDEASGVEILDELRRTKEALDLALATLTWYANETNYNESVERACAGEVLNKDTVEEVWLPDSGMRAREVLTKVTGKEFP